MNTIRISAEQGRYEANGDFTITCTVTVSNSKRKLIDLTDDNVAVTHVSASSSSSTSREIIDLTIDDVDNTANTATANTANTANIGNEDTIEKFNEAFKDIRYRSSEILAWKSVYRCKNKYCEILSVPNVTKFYPQLRGKFKTRRNEVCYKYANINGLLCLVKLCSCCDYWYHVSEFTAYFQHSAECQKCRRHRRRACAGHKRCHEAERNAFDNIVEESDDEHY